MLPLIVNLIIKLKHFTTNSFSFFFFNADQYALVAQPDTAYTDFIKHTMIFLVIIDTHIVVAVHIKTSQK